MTEAGFPRVIILSYIAFCCALISPGLSLAIAEGGNRAEGGDRAESTEDRFAAPHTTTGKSRELGHFEKDSARNVFGKRVSATEKQQLQYFKAISIETPKGGEGLAEGAHETLPPGNKISATEAQAPADNANLTPRDQLLKKFGDPDKEAPVQAIENAPTPFKAMMASLEAGDDELAFRFAMQHVRYMRKLQERSTRVMGLTGLAMEKEGLVERGTWSKNPQFNSDVELLDMADKEAAEKNEAAPSIDLDTKAKAMLAEALKEESTKPDGNLIFDEKRERARIRQELAGKVQPDPSGKVDVYFFFRPRDSASQDMARKIQKIYDEGLKKGGINLIGLSLAPMGEVEMREFRRVTGATFVLRDGQKLAPVLGVKSFPTVTLIGQKSAQVHMIQGAKPLYEIQETLSLMEGK